MSFFQWPSNRERSMLALIDSESLLPFESKKPTCPLPIQTPWGGGGASSAKAFVVAATTRRGATTVLNSCIVKIAPQLAARQHLAADPAKDRFHSRPPDNGPGGWYQVKSSGY